MSQGKNLTPLFDLLKKHPGQIRTGDGRPVEVEPLGKRSQPPTEKPRIRLTPRPAEPTEQDIPYAPPAVIPASQREAPLAVGVQREGAPQHDEAEGGNDAPTPQSDPGTLRVQPWVVGAAGFACLALLLVVWLAAFRRGEAKTVKERVEPLIARDGPKTTPGQLSNANPPSIPPALETVQLPPTLPNETTLPKAGAVVQEPAAPAPAGPEAGRFMLARGWGGADPREQGLNYLALVVLSKEHARDAVDFLAKNGVLAFAIPLDIDGGAPKNPPQDAYRVYAGPGVTSQQYKANDPAMGRLERRVAELGRVWSREHRGPSDFRSPGWVKFAGK
jgi:hypothetical protein